MIIFAYIFFRFIAIIIATKL